MQKSNGYTTIGDIGELIPFRAMRLCVLSVTQVVTGMTTVIGKALMTKVGHLMTSHLKMYGVIVVVELYYVIRFWIKLQLIRILLNRICMLAIRQN